MSEVFSKTPLGEIADLFMGQSPDSRFVHDGLEQGLPFLQGNSEFGEQYPEPIYSCAQPARTCKAGDVLISVRAPVGEVNLADTDYCIGRGLAAIRFHKIPPTLGRKLVSKFGAELRKVAQGTTFEAIGRKELASLNLLVPPIGERNLIAQILDTLDTQIRQTEVLIAKLERIKQGLLTDLLTRGINQDGQLRPIPEEAPQLFKESSLGWLPGEWDVRVAEEWCTGVADGTHDSPKPAKDGYPLVTSKNLKPEGLDIHDTYLISKRDYEAVVSRSWVKPGDILFGMIGTVGNPAIIRNGEQNIAPKNVGIFRVGGDYKKGRFLLAVLRSPLVDRQIDLSMLGSTQKFVGLGVLRSLLLPLPPYDELRMIVEVLEEFEERVRKERTELGKLNVEKFGLMDDLLTGRVRVTSLLEANERARA